MTTVPTTESIKASRVGGWLLAFSLLPFVLVVLLNVAVFSGADIGLFADIDREQMDALGGYWAVLALTVFAAYLVGNLGLVLVARSVRGAGVWPVLAVVAAVVAAASGLTDAILRISGAGFTEPRLGDNALYRSAEIVGNVAFSASALAIVLLAVSYFVSGAHRATGVIVGALGGVLFVVSLFAYMFVPPFAVALLWMPLGIVWLLGLRRAKVSDLG
jgi:hypothetical protein